MSYKESDFQTQFNKWAKSLFGQTAAFELKITKGNSLPFKALKEHQENALFLVKHHSIAYKIPDAGYQNPFDSFMLARCPAFVVVMFNAKSDTFYLIDIDDWMSEKERADRKSITSERAAEIGLTASLDGKHPITYNGDGIPKFIRTRAF